MAFIKSISVQEVQCRIRREFGVGLHGRLPYCSAILKWLHKLQNTGSVYDHFVSGTRLVCKAWTIDEVREVVIWSSSHSARHQSVALNLSDRYFCHNLHDDPNFHPYKTQISQQLLEIDKNAKWHSVGSLWVSWMQILLFFPTATMLRYILHVHCLSCFSCLKKCRANHFQFVCECFALCESCETYTEGLQSSCYEWWQSSLWQYLHLVFCGAAHTQSNNLCNRGCCTNMLTARGLDGGVTWQYSMVTSYIWIRGIIIFNSSPN